MCYKITCGKKFLKDQLKGCRHADGEHEEELMEGDQECMELKKKERNKGQLSLSCSPELKFK